MTCCSEKNAITIVRGNDTNFNGQVFLTLNLTTNVLDLSTFSASFVLGGITKKFDDLSSGTITINYNAKETQSLPFGLIYGVLKLFDNSGKVATIESKVPFCVIGQVSGNAIATIPYTLNFDVEQGGENILNVSVEAGVSVEVGTTNTLPAGSSATVTNSGTVNHLVLDFGIPQGEKGEQGEQGEQGPVGPDGKDAKINGVNTLTLTATDGLSLAQSGNVATLSGKSIQDSVTNEATNRSNADNNLQQQIDAIAASSDVTDIVGTHADLERYDTSKLKDNDIIKVLQDETDGGATTYYRWSTNTHTFTLIGEEGPYYTKGDADAKFVSQTRTINNKALDQNITLDASDVGAATSAQGALADTAVQPEDLSDYVTTNTQQNITAQKTFTTSAWNGGPIVNRTNSNSAFMMFKNADGILGGIGIGANEIPTWINKSSSPNHALVMSGTNSHPEKGNATTPIYVDSNSLAQEITDMATTDTAQNITATKTFTAQQKFQSGQPDGCIIIGADVSATTVTANTRKLGRMGFHVNENTTLNCAFVSTDTQSAASGGAIENCVDFGGRVGDETSTSPDVINFTVAKTHNTTTKTQKLTSFTIDKNANTFSNKTVVQTSSTWSDGLVAKRVTSGGSYVAIENSTGLLGGIGLDAQSRPSSLLANGTLSILVRGGDYQNPGVGSSTQPVYVDSSGVATAITNMATTNTAQTISGQKTFTMSAWNDGPVVKRLSDTLGGFILFKNNSGVLGAIGLWGNSIPVWLNSDNTEKITLVRGGSYSSPEVGDSVTPVYINSDGIAQPCTMNNYALISNVVSVSDNDTITLTNNTCFRGSTLSAFTISAPASYEYPFICEVDFVSSNPATTITYTGAGTIKWSPDSDDLVQGVFVPSINTEYTLMFWFNGTSICGIARAI